MPVEDQLQKELDQAKAGVHQRQKGEEKRLAALKVTKIKHAEQLRQIRIAAVDARFEEQRREVNACRPPYTRYFRVRTQHNASRVLAALPVSSPRTRPQTR